MYVCSMNNCCYYLASPFFFYLSRKIPAYLPILCLSPNGQKVLGEKKRITMLTHFMTANLKCIINSAQKSYHISPVCLLSLSKICVQTSFLHPSILRGTPQFDIQDNSKGWAFGKKYKNKQTKNQKSHHHWGGLGKEFLFVLTALTGPIGALFSVTRMAWPSSWVASWDVSW